MSAIPAALKVANWLAARRTESELAVERIAFARCAGWAFQAGVLRHESGRYFSVVGTRCTSSATGPAIREAPMIDQPEIGILGFVVRFTRSGTQWLLQAKTEPGNVTGTQVGPSVQATLSNYSRVHGGKPTPLLECFLDAQLAKATTLTDVLQSEQGDRFIGKFNRNMVAALPAGWDAPLPPNLAWFDAAAVREALHTDFAVNTDARSVLCSCDWSLLADDRGDGAFACWRRRPGFGNALLQSFLRPADPARLVWLETQVRESSSSPAVGLERCGVADLSGWTVGAVGIVPAERGTEHEVQAFAVHAADREVTGWCQPLMVGAREERIVLLCAVQAGVLRFLVREGYEPGFGGSMQFAPSHNTGAAHARSAAVEAALAHSVMAVHASVKQSDEGGRFKDSVARYEIVEVNDEVLSGSDINGHHWLTLTELHALATRAGVLTNELRSVVSMLLAWA